MKFTAYIGIHIDGAEQIGMKAGMLVTACFPLLGVIVLLILRWFFAARKFEK